MINPTQKWISAAACGLILAVACDNAGSDRVLSVGLTGHVTGVVFIDQNGNRVQDASDTALAGVQVQILGRATGAVARTVTTTAAGVFTFDNLAVGDYRLRVDTATIGDTLEISDVSLDTVSVLPGDTTSGTVRVSFPFSSVAALRLAAPGTKVFLEVVALSSRNNFGDTTIHVVDTSGALRVTRVRPASVLVADSVRLLGRRNNRDGQPTLDDVTVFPINFGVLPTATGIGSGTAASANGGLLDAALVSVLSLTITDTATVQGGYRLTADDGSGALSVFLAQGIGFVTGPLLPDSIIDATGVLVPTGTGSWVLKPRQLADVIRQ